MSHTILLVDADESITAFLADQLAADGYQAVVARTLDAVYDTGRRRGARGRRAGRPGRAPPRPRPARRRPRRRAALRPRRPRRWSSAPTPGTGRAARLRPRRRRRGGKAGQLPGAARPRRGAPAPPARAPRRDPARARPRDRRPRAPRQAGGRADRADPARVHAARAPGGRARAGIHQGRADHRALGLPRGVHDPQRSTPTWPACATSSAPTATARG